jgi:positive regulator of sigma E activity
MDYKRIRNISVAFLVFLIIVLIFSFIAGLLGETSSTGPIKIFSWIIGSVIAFKIFEVLSGEDKKNPPEKESS